MSSPDTYLHRRATIATHNPDAPWSVFFMDEEGEPDAETVCRLQDAIEADSSILLCARTAEGLESIAEVLDRMLADTPDRVLN